MFVKKLSEIKSEVVQAGDLTLRQVLIGPDEGPNFSMRRFVIKPGGSIPSHTNSIEHEQYVLSGKAKIGIGDEVFEVKKDDIVFIPAKTAHWYEVVGEESFEFICVVPNGDDQIKLTE